ncbi:DUF192 domain-containing protein [Nitrospira sp. M1]
MVTTSQGQSLTHPPTDQEFANDGLAEIITPQKSIIMGEIADTPAERSKGLMFRTHMPPDHGMLFIFQELDYWNFWMKNTKIPLDIIWIDVDWKVVHIESHVPICTKTDDSCPRYRTLKEALYVLELGAGMAKHYNIRLGSQLIVK